MKSYYSSALLVLVVAAIVTALAMVNAGPSLAHHIWGDDPGDYAGPSVELSDVRVDTDVGLSLARGIMFDDIDAEHAAGLDGDHYAFRHEHISAD